MRRALLALVLLAGCGSAPPARQGVGPAGWGAIGQTPAKVATSNAAQIASATWDVLVEVSPVDARVEEEAGSWKLTANDNRGALTVMVMRDPAVQDAWSLAEALRADREKRGENVSETDRDTLVGLPAARWVSVSDGGVATLVVLTKSGSCVYMLIASAQGTTDEVVSYFKWAAALVRTASGGAANAPACRS